MLFRAPKLGPAELAVIEKIEEARGLLASATRATPWKGQLRRNAFARAVQGSNSIEGYHVTMDDAVAAVENEEPTEAGADTWNAIMGYRKAMTYVLQLWDDQHFSFSRGLIKSLHFMMIGHDLSKHPGKWRPGFIYVRNEETKETVYEGPPADLLNGLMEEFVAVLNDDPSHSLVKGAMAHLNLVMIHPFSDGNGRMGRCLQTLALARGQILNPVFCSIEEYLGAHQREYYDVLGEVGAGGWHPENDASPWLRFCLTAHFRQAHDLVRWTRIFQRLYEQLDTERVRLGLPDRMHPALSDAAIGYKVRNAIYQKNAGVSESVAGRDLKALAESGLLTPHGEKRGRYYVASEGLKEIYRKAWEPYRPLDPFDTQGSLPGMSPLAL